MNTVVIYPGRRTLRMTDCLGLRAQLLVDTLKCDILDVDTMDTFIAESYDRVILIEGIFRFVSQKFRDMTEWLISHCRKEVVYATADYESRVPSLARWLPSNVKPIRWSQYPLTQVKERDFPFVKTKIVDWNAIFWMEPLPIQDYEFEGLFYYGSFKERRRFYYDEYLNYTQYPVVISAKRGQRHMFSQSPTVKFVDPVPSVADLGKAQFTVYFLNEDAVGTAPAQRFYECLVAGLPIFFDKDFYPDFKHLPDVSSFLLDGQDDAGEAYEQVRSQKDRRKIIEHQRSLWAGTDYKKILIDQIKEAAQ